MTVSGTRMTHLWIRWAEIAIDNEQLSVAAKNKRTADNLHPHLGTEFNHGTVAVCAAVFSMEALTMALASLTMPPATVMKWRGPRSISSIKKIQQVLGHAVKGPRGPQLAVAWETYIRRRNEAVHFLGDSRPSVPYDGLNVAIEDEAYSSEAAKGAVDSLLDTLDAVITSPKPPVRDWANGFRDNSTSCAPGEIGRPALAACCVCALAKLWPTGQGPAGTALSCRSLTWHPMAAVQVFVSAVLRRLRFSGDAYVIPRRWASFDG